MKSIISFIDKYLCKYIGITKQNVIPQTIKKDNHRITLRNTESHKRHPHEQSWEDFSETSLDELSDTAKQKLGVSLGKAIARNLVISFDKTTIIKE